MVTSTVRWARGGDDRLHVGTVDGRRLGWYDLRTGETQLLDPDPRAAAEMRAAVDAYLVTTSPLRRRPPSTPSPPGCPRPARPATPSARASEPGHPGRRTCATGSPASTSPASCSTGSAPRPPAAGGPPPATPSVRPCATPTRRSSASSRWAAPWPGSAPAGTCCTTCRRPARSWLDHLLVGPGGVVVLRTAAHPGETVRITGSLVRAGGRPVSHVRLLRSQAATVTERLRGRRPARCLCAGVVVVVGARSVQATGLPAGVAVVRLEDLAPVGGGPAHGAVPGGRLPPGRDRRAARHLARRGRRPRPSRDRRASVGAGARPTGTPWPGSAGGPATPDACAGPGGRSCSAAPGRGRRASSAVLPAGRAAAGRGRGGHDRRVTRAGRRSRRR